MTEQDEPLEGKIVKPSKREAGLTGWVADVTPVEAFEAVKEMARLAREENEDLKARVAALEARLGPGRAP